jgi:hypothetical protein
MKGIVKIVYRLMGYNCWIEFFRGMRDDEKTLKKAMACASLNNSTAMHIISINDTHIGDGETSEVLVWPDGTWWWADELNELPGYMSDDFFRMWFPLHMTDNGVDQEVHAVVNELHKPKDEWIEV